MTLIVGGSLGVGCGVGVGVGEGLGGARCDWLGDGDPVGLDDGLELDDDCGVDVGVGWGVGLAVAAGVGLGVGSAVGCGVGEGVCAWVGCGVVSDVGVGCGVVNVFEVGVTAGELDELGPAGDVGDAPVLALAEADGVDVPFAVADEVGDAAAEGAVDVAEGAPLSVTAGAWKHALAGSANSKTTTYERIFPTARAQR